MAFDVATGAIIEVRHVQALNEQIIMNVRHYRLGVSTPTDGRELAEALLDEIAEGVAAPWMATLASMQSSWLINGPVDMQWIFPTRYITFTLPNPLNGGTVAEAALPQNVSAVATLRPDLAIRGRVGSFHVAGAPVDQDNGGSWQPAYQTSLQTLATQLATPIVLPDASTVFNPILLKKSTPAESLLVTSGTYQQTVRVMRRRTVGLGI